MAAPPLPPRASSFASQDTISSTSSRDAALHGATSAFARPTPNAKPAGNARGGANGALVAASNASIGSQPSSSNQYTEISPPRSLARTSTQGSAQSVKSNLNRLSQGEATTSAARMAVPPHPARAQSRSPSEQAAFLAAARAVPADDTASVPRRAATTRRPAAPPKPRRLSSYGGRTGGNEADTPTDATSIPPTTSLVDLFERKSSTSRPSGRKPEPIVIKPSGDLPMQSPKPLRATSGIPSMIQMHADEEQKDDLINSARSSAVPQPNNKHALPPTTLGSTNVLASSSATAANDLEPLSIQAPNKLKPDYEFPKREPVKAQNTMSTRAGPETTYLGPIKSNESRYSQRRPSPSPLRDSTVGPFPIHQVNRSATAPTEGFPPSSSSVKSIPAQYNLMYPRRQTPNMTGDQLANAMVASSLASSRQQSPARQMEAPPLPSRRHKHHTLSLSRTPTPSKMPGLRKTLRQPQSEESDDEDEGLYPHGKRKVQKRLGKHPNKHHEGDRKRWRESVTERERKRYEGVWAANKGLYSSFTVHEHAVVSRIPKSLEAQELREMVAEQVSNIVVRDIWSRSRLPETVLENVWDLVDNNQVGRLSKEEFVVGLWLIDGHLKGKKLPVRVSDSVWRSVKGLHGISLKVKK